MGIYLHLILLNLPAFSKSNGLINVKDILGQSIQECF